MPYLRTHCSPSGEARNRIPSITIHDWQCTQLGIIIHSTMKMFAHVVVLYQHIYRKSKHTYTIFSLIAPNIAEPATNGGADEPAFAITIPIQTIKNRSRLNFKQNSQYLDPRDILIYHIGDKGMLR